MAISCATSGLMTHQALRWEKTPLLCSLLLPDPSIHLNNFQEPAEALYPTVMLHVYSKEKSQGGLVFSTQAPTRWP